MDRYFLFDSMNTKFEAYYVSHNDSINAFEEDIDMYYYDIYIKFDLGRFTEYDTGEMAQFQLHIEKFYGDLEVYLYETDDYDLDKIEKLSNFSSTDRGYNENYIDYKKYHSDSKSKIDTIPLDLTSLFNKAIKLKKRYLSFRIYHDKSKSFYTCINEFDKATIFGYIHRFKYIRYDSNSLGAVGTSNVDINNGALRFDFPSFDTGGNLLNTVITFAYSKSVHSNSGLVGNFILSSFEYLIRKTDDYIIIKDVTLNEEIYHKLSVTSSANEPLDYAGYTCADNETYYSSGIESNYVTIKENSNNIYELKLVKNNIVRIFDYNNSTNKNKIVNGQFASITNWAKENMTSEDVIKTNTFLPEIIGSNVFSII